MILKWKLSTSRLQSKVNSTLRSAYDVHESYAILLDTTMESQHQDLSLRAQENSFVPPEENRPVLPADLLNLNDAEMAKLFEPRLPNGVLLEAYSYQDMQDIVCSNPDLINESFESLIQELDELSQPGSSPSPISEESKPDHSVFFGDSAKFKLKEEPKPLNNISSQNILSAGAPSFPNTSFVSPEVATCYLPMPPEHFPISIQRCKNSESIFTTFFNAYEGKSKCKIEANETLVKSEEIELSNERIDSTVTCDSAWATMPACNDQTVSSSQPLHPQSFKEKDKNVTITMAHEICVEDGLCSSLQGITSSSKSLNNNNLMIECSDLQLKVQEAETVLRKLSCDSSSILENMCVIEQQVLDVIHSVQEKVETNIKRLSFNASSSKVKLEVLNDTETIKCPHKCDVCNQEFSLLTNISHHQSSHTRKQAFCCDPCDLVFITDAELLTHNTKFHNYSNGYCCEICSDVLPSYPEFLEHLGHHSKQEPFKCGECDFKFRKFSNYCLHMCQHTGELIFKCIVCSSLFRSKEDLFSHQRFFHSPNIINEEKNSIKKNENTFQCEACGKTFNKLRAMLMHKTVKHKVHKAGFSKKKLNLCCATCRKSFATAKTLKAHTAAAHRCNVSVKKSMLKSLTAAAQNRTVPSKKKRKQSTLKCGDCEKVFYSNAVYNRHVLTHQPKARRSSLKAKFQIKVSSLSFREVKFLCEFCCDPFHRAADLKKHKELVHSSGKDKVGPLCQRKTRRRGSLDSVGSFSDSASARTLTPTPANDQMEEVSKDKSSADLIRQKFQVIQESNEVWVNVNNNMLRGVKAEGSHPKQLENACKLIRQGCGMTSSNDDESVLHFCIQCSLSFKNIFELIQHKQLHPLPFLCPTCGLSYLIESDLINHICVF